MLAIYPGSFDPLTNGHLDLIRRGARLFERLIVAVLRNEGKQPFFSIAERMEMIQEGIGDLANVAVDSFGGLSVEYAAAQGAGALLRGIRNSADYEYERQMALMNYRLAPGIETVTLGSSEAFSFISSRLIKEVVALGGDVSGLVPASVEARLRKRFHPTSGV